MSTAIRRPSNTEVVYPDSDGMPVAENTLQFQWIMTIQGGLDRAFRDDPDVFVAGDLLWYPVEGDPATCMAPDAMVVIGRPKGHRGSYIQYREGGIAPQVVFEILSPGNRVKEMTRKLRFYERFGVEEYYLYDPDGYLLDGWLREGDELREIAEMGGWLSPRLGIRFDTAGDDLVLFGPDGVRFATYLELAEQRDAMAEQRDALAEQAAEQRRRAERLEARLRELGVDPEG